MNRAIIASVAIAVSMTLTASIAHAAPTTATPAPGDVLTARAVNLPGFWYASAWHITYRSTSAARPARHRQRHRHRALRRRREHPHRRLRAGHPRHR